MESRQRKHLLLAFAGIVALVAGLLLFLNRNPEPTYNGRPLSEWISAYQGPFTTLDQPTRTQAAEAICAIGTNALPVLVDWIDYDPGPLRRHALTHWDKLPSGLRNNSILQRALFGGHRRSGLAQSAFTVLRDQAIPAIPVLHQLARDSDSPDTRRGAASALGAIGPGAMTAMTNILATAQFDERRLIMNALEKLGTNAAPAVPVLVQQLQHGEMRTATASAQALAILRLDLDLVIPALIDRLADPHPRIRAAAAKALGSFGARAIIALPALNQLETDPDKEVSRAARDAITSITGVAPSGADPLPIGSR